jgi:glycosyltransferase involved in cell wall biosynthesis
VLPKEAAAVRSDLFWLGGKLITLFAVAHSRDFALSVGGFNENLWCDVRGEFCKRLAREGARFLYVSASSGRLHVNYSCNDVESSILPRHRYLAKRNFLERNPLHHNSERPYTGSRPVTKVLFACAHSLIDFSSGAAIASMDVLESLDSAGFECQAFCTPMLDFDKDVCFEQIIERLGEPFRLCRSLCGTHRASVLYTRRRRVPITFMNLDSTRIRVAEPDKIVALLAFFQRFLEYFQPDVVITIDFDPISRGMIALAKRRDIPVVFTVHNFAHNHVRSFEWVDYCTTPSEFARRYYWEQLGLACQALPNPVNWNRVRADNADARFVTFVNPSIEKGVFAFARMADELGRRRPDIPLLVVESRGNWTTLASCGLDPFAHGNVQCMPNTHDPRQFWRKTKVLLMPSLWWESQGLVAVEAMINGIPVIGSDRGAIPETLGDSGYHLALPERLTPFSRTLPDVSEVEPWIDTVIRLWDDPILYRQESAKARNEAERFHPDRLRPLYAEFFRNVYPQPGPPFLPKEP